MRARLLGGSFGSAQGELFGLPVTGEIWGSHQFGPESVVAYEAGYRVQAGSGLALDAALYHNQYSDLREIIPIAPRCLPGGIVVSAAPECLASAEAIALPFQIGNGPGTTTQGLELSANWQPRRWVRLQPTYTYFTLSQDDVDPMSIDTAGLRSPSHQASVRASIDPWRRTQVDGWVRTVGDIPAYQIDAYVALDGRVAWRLSDELEVSLIGRNLLGSSRPEFLSELGDIPLIEVQRSAYVALRWGR